MENKLKNKSASRPEFYFYRKKILSLVAKFVDACGYAFFKENKNNLKIDGKILVVNLGGVGDLILSEPLLSSLLTLGQVDLVCAPGNEKGLLGRVKINKVFYLSLPWSGGKKRLGRTLIDLWRLGGRLKQEKYEVAFDVKGDPAVILLLWLARIRQRIGFNNGGLGFLLTRPMSQPQHLHRSKIDCALLQPLDGNFSDRDRVPYLQFVANQNFFSAEKNYRPGYPTITVHIGTSAPARLWPLAYWEKLILMIVDDYNVAIIGGFQESKDFQSFPDRIKSSVINLCERPWLDTANALKNSVLFVGSNSGPGHLASALGCPVISIFSAANDPAEWAPAGAKVLTFRTECAGCEKITCANPICLQRVLPNDVSNLINNMCQAARNKI